MLALAVLVPAGCAVSRSTRMTADDLATMSDEMAQSLRRSPALRDRKPDSPRWVISIQKVTNLTSDVMTEGEQWYAVQKVRSGLPILALSKERNIHFVLPAERVRQLRNDPDVGKDVGDFGDEFGKDRQPTHVMTATFRSITRADAEHASELYYCEFEIMDLATAVPVWIDKFEYKRVAEGHIWD